MFVHLLAQEHEAALPYLARSPAGSHARSAQVAEAVHAQVLGLEDVVQAMAAMHHREEVPDADGDDDVLERVRADQGEHQTIKCHSAPQ